MTASEIYQARTGYGVRYQITLVCDNCGAEFIRDRYVARAGAKRNRHVFCGQRCKGQWAGRHYGFGAAATRTPAQAR